MVGRGFACAPLEQGRTLERVAAPLPGPCSSPVTVFRGGGTACGFLDVSDCPCTCVTGVGSFLLYSVHEGIRGIPLDPNDKSDALVPVSGTSLAVGIDFHAGDVGLGTGQGGAGNRTEDREHEGTITRPPLWQRFTLKHSLGSAGRGRILEP